MIEPHNQLFISSSKNQRGNVLLVVIIVIAIIGGLLMLILQRSASVENVGLAKKQTVQSNIGLVRYQLLALLNNPHAFLATIASSTNVNLSNCMNNVAFSCPNVTTALELFDASGSSVYSALNANQGFDRNGAFCTTYGLIPDDGCLFRFQVTWTPTCPTVGTCNTPPITFEFTLQSNAPSTNSLYLLNTANYSYSKVVN